VSVLCLFFVGTASAQTKPMSLPELLAYAQERSPLLVSAKSYLRHAEAEREAATLKYLYNPQLSVGLGPRASADGTSFDVDASLGQSFELSGQRGIRLKTASAMQDTIGASLEVVRWEIHTQVHRAFHEALLARERVKVAERLLAFAEKTLEITKKRLAAGDVSALAVKLSEVDVAQAKQSKIAAESTYKLSRITLAEVTGLSVASPPEIEGRLDSPRKAPSFDELYQLALQKNPEFLVNQSNAKEAALRESLAEKEASAVPFFGLGFSSEGAGSGATESIAMFNFGVSFPVWQKNQGDRARARAEKDIAEAQSESLRLLLQGRIARGAEAINSSVERLAVFGEEILPNFESNLALLQRAFELGQIDILEVGVARERFIEIESQALDAYADYYRATSELEAELGAELWPDETH
jgi:cobalt-zinc-cadmium efflux system outer membrane protein